MTETCLLRDSEPGRGDVISIPLLCACANAACAKATLDYLDIKTIQSSLHRDSPPVEVAGSSPANNHYFLSSHCASLEKLLQIKRRAARSRRICAVLRLGGFRTIHSSDLRRLVPVTAALKVAVRDGRGPAPHLVTAGLDDFSRSCRSSTAQPV